MNTRKRIKSISVLFALFCACMIFAIGFSSNGARDVYAYEQDKEANYAWSTSGLTVSTVSDVYYEGEKSLKIVDTIVASESSAQLDESFRFEVTSGVIYEVSAWFCSKNCSADATFKLHLYLYEYVENSVKSSTKLAGTTYALNAGTNLSQWQKAVTRLEIPTAPNGGTYYAAYYLETSGGYANVWVDLFSCFIVEDENEVIIEYDDFSAFSNEQKANLGNYAKTQQMGEWQLESEKEPSAGTANISRYTDYAAEAGDSQKHNALCLYVYKNQGCAYVTKRLLRFSTGTFTLYRGITARTKTQCILMPA